MELFHAATAAYEPRQSFIRTATACPEIRVGDVTYNIARIDELFRQATSSGTALVVFPELSLTGYTLGDLVQQRQLLDQAERGLSALAHSTKNAQTAMVVGLPLCVQDALYNCAAVLSGGKVRGIVPKTYLPTYNEFYERRWYETWQHPNSTVQIDGQEVPFGTDLLFDVGGSKLGVEICEDAWVARPPSIQQALRGAQLIANPSASPEQVGKASYRRDMVRMHSGQLIAGYLYAGCHPSESTADVVMGGHQLIAANAVIQAERKPFGAEQLLVADIDLDHLQHDRRRQHMAKETGGQLVMAEIERQQADLGTKVERNPFLPDSEPAAARAERLEAALTIQAYGLAMRMQASRQERVVLGLSGGLDSTLALLVAHRASVILGKDAADMIHTLTMPGPASSQDTQHNAQQLARELGAQNTVIPIGELVQAELAALGHDGVAQDVTYENVQARARTNLLFNYANLSGGMVLGTGDLSEIALGWCTYNGDQQSHYNVNASIPKTLAKHLVAHVAAQPEYLAARQTLQAILSTTISPELTSSDRQSDRISQSTEDIIGPYELHDFFLYHLVRWGDRPEKIKYLARQAFADCYEDSDIDKWFGVFISRFALSQFKRENLPNGPKVGSVSLSQRGDWRMPPDLHNGALWEQPA